MNTGVHTFLDFQLDEDLFELRSRGEVIATQARVFALIRYLLQHRQRVVSKEELVKALWDGAVVSDTAISQVVMLARKALRDEGDRQRVIKTVRGRGFRFIAEVDAEAAPKSVPPLPVAPQVVHEPSALLDRAGELSELAAQLARAGGGHGSLVLIGGEPGIGKTSLVSEFAKRAAHGGGEVLWGRAWEDGGAPPFWPWIQVLRALERQYGTERIKSALGASARELSTLVPELASESAADGGQELDGPRARFRQFDAIARLLRALPSTRARAIIFEDLHAADEASIQLLRFLLPELDELGTLIVATFRDLELTPGSALALLADGGAGMLRHLQLRGLRADAAAVLIERTLGRTPAQRDVDVLFALAGGNPLLLSALSQQFAASGRELSELAAHPVPERMASAVHKHLAQLPAATREALSMAAALGREFPAQHLAGLLACSEPELHELLEPARRRAIIRHASGDASQLSFAHALVCHAIYQELGAARRIELHRRIGELLETGVPPERQPLYELAHHYYRAAADGCRAKAIEYARRAAAHAESVSAHETSASLYERALNLSDVEAVDGAAWHELACTAGEAHYRAGQLEAARACFERAMELALREQNAERYAWAVLRCCSALRGSIITDLRRQEHVRHALAQLPPEDSMERALLMAANLLANRSRDDLQRRVELTQRAVDMARAIGAPLQLQWTLDAQHIVLWGVAEPKTLQPIAEEIIALSDRTGDHESLLDGLLWRMADASDAGDMVNAMLYSTEYVRRAEQLGSPWHRYMAMGSECFHACTQGEFVRAFELSEQVRRLGVRVGENVAEGFYEVRRLFMALHLGGECATEPPECVPEDMRLFWALSSAQSNQPHNDGFARRTLGMLAASDFDGLLLGALRLPSWAAMARVAVMLGDRAASARLYELLAPYEGRHLNVQAWVYMGPVSYYLGHLAAASGERARARAHLERALNETALMPLFQAYAQYELGQLLAAGGDASGRALLAAAQQTADSFGLLPLQARIAAALGCKANTELMHN